MSRFRRASTTASGSASRARAMPESPGGAAGDVYVLVRVLPDERFVRDGNDIYSTVDVPMTRRRARHPRGDPDAGRRRDVELAPGTQPGHVRVLGGRGCPSSRETAAATTGFS